MLIPQAIVQSGASLSQSYLGYNTIGGTWGAMSALTWYTKKITLASDGLLTSIDAYVRTNTGDHAAGFAAAVFSDTAGSPDLVIAQSHHPTVSSYFSKAGATNGSGRWYSQAMGIWLLAGSYWISVSATSTANDMDLAFDAAGSDRTQSPSFWGAIDWNGLAGPTTTANAYSIRASILS